jgi:hypothetical protein
LQVRDAFEKQQFVSHGNAVEQDQVLVDLAHIADMRNYRQSKLSRQQANRKKLRNAGDSGAINLYKMRGACLHEVLEHNAIWNVFA